MWAKILINLLKILKMHLQKLIKKMRSLFTKTTGKEYQKSIETAEKNKNLFQKMQYIMAMALKINLKKKNKKF